MENHVCRECGLDYIGDGTVIDGELLCWAEDDLCSRCDDVLAAIAALERDAARYRFLRDRSTTATAIAAGGVFAGQVPDNLILGGEDLDRAVDAAMGGAPSQGQTLEARLAECLADCIDMPLMQMFDPDGGERMVEVRMSSLNRALAERAATLLEEAGR